MQIIISGKQMKLTEGIKACIDDKFSRLERYLNPETEVKVTLSPKKDRQKIEVTIMPVNGPIIRAEEVEEDLYSAIDIVYEKLYKQLVKYKTKTKDKEQQSKSIKFDAIEIENYLNEEDEQNENSIIKRRKKINVKPMSPEEAILQMELIGHNFYIFKNQDTDEMNIVYKRKANGYGLIEQE